LSEGAEITKESTKESTRLFCSPSCYLLLYFLLFISRCCRWHVFGWISFASLQMELQTILTQRSLHLGCLYIVSFLRSYWMPWKSCG